MSFNTNTDLQESYQYTTFNPQSTYGHNYLTGMS